MAAQHASGNWEDLGQQLEQRRAQLSPRWANLAQFARDRDIDWRLCWDLEHAARSNYRRPTLYAAAYAYQVTPESLFAVIAGTGTLAAAGVSEQERQILAAAPEALRRLAERDKGDRAG